MIQKIDDFPNPLDKATFTIGIVITTNHSKYSNITKCSIGSPYRSNYVLRKIFRNFGKKMKVLENCRIKENNIDRS